MVVQSKTKKSQTPLKKKTLCTQNRQLPKDWSIWAPKTALKFDAGIDETVAFERQQTACIESVEAEEHSTIWLHQTLSANGYKGKRIRWTGYIKTENIEEQAVLWLDVLASDGARLAMDNMANRPVQNSSDWTKCVLVVDVPADALHIRLACSVSGTGTAWFAGLEFEVVDTTVAKTDNFAIGCRGVWLNYPTNIDLLEREDNESYVDDQWPGILPKGWLRWGTPTSGYEMGSDDKVFYVNAVSGTLKALAKREDSDFACFSQKFGAPPYRSKRIRLTGFVKMQDVTGYCGLVMRVLDIYSSDITVENTYDLSSSGTSDWTKHEIVMDVPERAGVISIGANITGGGQMWFDGLAFEEVGTDVSLTFSQFKAGPLNLNFKTRKFTVQEESSHSVI